MILSFDTSSRSSVSLGKEGVCLYEEARFLGRDQAASFVPFIQEALVKTSISVSELSAIVVTRGPGSFTGIRVGLAVAQGFGLALSIPVHGVTCFDAFYQCVSEALKKEKDILVVLDTKKATLDVQLFPKGTPKGNAPESWLPKDLTKRIPDSHHLLIVGTAIDPCMPYYKKATLIREGDLPMTPAWGATLRWEENRTRHPEDFPATPFYLRSASVTLKHESLSRHS